MFSSEYAVLDSYTLKVKAPCPFETFENIYPPVAYSKFWTPSKILQNSTQLWKLLKIAEFRTPAPQDVRKKAVTF